MPAITAPSLSIFTAALADFALPISIFALALSITALAPSIFFSAPAILLSVQAISALKSGGFLAEVEDGNGVGAFSTRFPSSGGAAFDAMAG
jgi:hypothetical protein